MGLTGCGSAEILPPAATPAASPPLERRPAGRVVPRVDAGPPTAPSGGARLDPRARTVRLPGGEPLGAGVGPTRIVETEAFVYVTDTAQEALLVYEKGPALNYRRRAHLPGAPYALAVDEARDRLWVTLTATNELVGFTLDGGVQEVERYPTVRQPGQVRVDGTSVVVTGSDQTQTLTPSGA